MVDDDEAYANLLMQVLFRRGYNVITKTHPQQALNWLRVPGNKPDLMLLDVMMPGLSGYDVLRQVRSDPLLATLPVIMLTAKGEITDKVAGYEAGADDYLVKPVHPVDLDLRIKALLGRAHAAAPPPSMTGGATIISVFSLRGGVGVTSLAVNLAIALVQLWQARVVLLDLALTNAHCSLFLNLKPKYSLGDVVEWQTAAVEAEIVDRLLVSHDTGVQLLAAPATPVLAEQITSTVLDRVWPQLRARWRFLVVDAGSQLSEVALTCLERAHSIVLPFVPELGSLKATKEALSIFEQLGLPAERLHLVQNSTIAQDGLSPKVISSVLTQPLAAAIPYERGFVRAINLGRPLFVNEPKSAACLAVASLAYRLSPYELKSEKVARPSEWLKRVRQLPEHRA